VPSESGVGLLTRYCVMRSRLRVPRLVIAEMTCSRLKPISLSTLTIVGSGVNGAVGDADAPECMVGVCMGLRSAPSPRLRPGLSKSKGRKRLVLASASLEGVGMGVTRLWMSSPMMPNHSY
jgi:hypothetical protein